MKNGSKTEQKKKVATLAIVLKEIYEATKGGLVAYRMTETLRKNGFTSNHLSMLVRVGILKKHKEFGKCFWAWDTTEPSLPMAERILTQTSKDSHDRMASVRAKKKAKTQPSTEIKSPNIESGKKLMQENEDLKRQVANLRKLMDGLQEGITDRNNTINGLKNDCVEKGRKMIEFENEAHNLRHDLKRSMEDARAMNDKYSYQADTIADQEQEISKLKKEIEKSKTKQVGIFVKFWRFLFAR